MYFNPKNIKLRFFLHLHFKTKAHQQNNERNNIVYLLFITYIDYFIIFYQGGDDNAPILRNNSTKCSLRLPSLHILPKYLEFLFSLYPAISRC